MFWLSCSACGLLLAFSTIAAGCEKQVPRMPADERNGTQGVQVKATELKRDLLARFKVPEKSSASDESPLRIEAEIVRATERPPYMLSAYVLLPIKAREQAGKDPMNADEYLKLSFGKMDVVAPLKTKEPFLLFPYEDAERLRKYLKPGDVVLVGIEALPLTVNEQKGERLDVDVKVRRVISW